MARATQILIGITALVFAFRAVEKQWTSSSVDLGQIHPDWTWVALSGLIFLSTYAVLVETWREMLRVWGNELPFSKAVRIWSISNLGRYIPGKLWQVGAMAAMAERAGVSAIAATGSAIVNVVVNLIAGFVLVATFAWPLLQLEQVGGIRSSIALVAVCVVSLALLPIVLPKLLRVLSRLTGRNLDIGAMPTFAIVLSFIGNVIAWLLYGVAFALFARGVLGSSQGTLTAYVAVYALSYLVGYLVLFAPAGAGFREAAMVVLLPAAHLANPTQALVLAITSRLWLTILEITPGALFLGVDSLRRRPREQ